MGREIWPAIVHGVTELYTTEVTEHIPLLVSIVQVEMSDLKCNHISMGLNFYFSEHIKMNKASLLYSRVCQKALGAQFSFIEKNILNYNFCDYKLH